MAIKAIDLIKPAEAVSGGQQRRITVSDAVRYLAGDDGGHQQAQIVLRAPAELEPGELERRRVQIILEREPTEAERQRAEHVRAEANRFLMGVAPADRPQLERLSAEIKQYALEPEPTDVDRQMVERVKAEADRFMLVSPTEVERMRAQLDHPLLLSPDEAQRVAAQFTSSMAPVALGEYAAELMRPLQSAYSAEYLSAWAEPIHRAIESSTLSAALAAQAAALGIVHQVLNPMALDMISTTMEMMREPSRQMAEMAASWAQPFGAMDVGRAALSLSRDLQMAQNALRNSGYSLGLLDDTDRALDRLYEQRQAPPARRPEPPAERVQVVHLGDEVLLAELDRRLRVNSLSSEAKRSMARLLHAYTGRGKPGPQEPPMETKVKLIEDYERLRDRKRITQDAYVAHYAHKILAVSLRTFQSYIKEVRLWRESLDDTE